MSVDISTADIVVVVEYTTQQYTRIKCFIFEFYTHISHIANKIQACIPIYLIFVFTCLLIMVFRKNNTVNYELYVYGWNR